ncbi:MAG: MotA/TolQ/ExbB proton channel family protein [Thermodesulfovibrionales bacterium]|nr:MotA/TolQ/ExbB proton channel family protein [Thermodesulfovibrionales bacterium]
MNITSALESYLYVISTMLFLPVLLGLTLMTFWVLIYLGSFIREWVDRRNKHRVYVEAYQRALQEKMIAPLVNPIVEAERLLQKHELAMIKSLDKIRFVIRVGPALGLMGTLIPMGIALSALAQGDMPKMAGSMVTAFTTVIVGLACSVVAYVVSLIKEKWVRADMREMEYFTEITLQDSRFNERNSNVEVQDEVFKESEKV